MRADLRVRGRGVKLAGFPAWWLFRSVHLMKMPGLSRKARVAFVQLGVHR